MILPSFQAGACSIGKPIATRAHFTQINKMKILYFILLLAMCYGIYVLAAPFIAILMYLFIVGCMVITAGYCVKKLFDK